MQRSFKLDKSVPVVLENILRNKYGFTVTYVTGAGYLICSKPVIPNTTLNDQKIAALTKQCENIANFYPNKSVNIHAIRTRLLNIANAMPMLQKHFVENYVDEHFPLEKAE